MIGAVHAAAAPPAPATPAPPAPVKSTSNERPLDDRYGGGSHRAGHRRRRDLDDCVRGHAHARRPDEVRQTAGRGSHRGRDRDRRWRRTGRPRAWSRGHLSRRAVRHAARRLQPVRADAHPVAVGRRPVGRRARTRVPAAIARRIQRDGGPSAHARRPTRVPQAPAAVPAQPVRGLPVPEHLRPVTRSVRMPSLIIIDVFGPFDPCVEVTFFPQGRLYD